MHLTLLTQQNEWFNNILFIENMKVLVSSGNTKGESVETQKNSMNPMVYDPL